MSILLYCWWLTLLSIDLCVSDVQFPVRLYHSDRMSVDDLDHDCLLYDGTYSYPDLGRAGQTVNRPYQIIPYCIRHLHSDDDLSTHRKSLDSAGAPLTFQQLMHENVTSEMLYLSSIPIDTVERYQAFLDSQGDVSSEQRLYNCSLPWFGEFCQYRPTSMEPFEQIAKSYIPTFEAPSTGLDPVDYITCYTFMKCDRGPWPSCLDWREICDGKIDCLNGGVDEVGCEDLDSNQCDEDEYQCGNGFCISIEFFNDDMYNPDCMDASDEKQDPNARTYSIACHYDPTFRCEEKTCRKQSLDVCGDGQCERGVCKNERDTLLSQAKLSWNANRHLPFECWMSLICLTSFPFDVHRLIQNVTNACPSWYHSASMGREHCPEHFFFPAQPVVLGHVRFVYERNASLEMNLYPWRPSPYYVCYDPHMCESITPTTHFNGSSCLLFTKIYQRGGDSSWITFERLAAGFFIRCSRTEKTYATCPTAKPFRCANSSKCLSLNRVMDGALDCIEGDDEKVAHSCTLPDQRFRFKCLSDSGCVDITSIDTSNYMCKVFGEWTGEKRITRETPDDFYPQSFTTVCNGFTDHSLDGSINYTDEINCERWPCNNVYTRCDDQGVWNCLNGADEVDCPGNPCRPHGHPCISLQDNNLTCLPLARINDGIVDCLGAFDERKHCREATPRMGWPAYRCFNATKCIGTNFVCSPFPVCLATEDNSDWCKDLSGSAVARHDQIDAPRTVKNWNFKKYLKALRSEIAPHKLKYFTVTNHLIYPSHHATTTHNDTSSVPQEIDSKNALSSDLTKQSANHSLDIYCKRGILVYANDSAGRYCLCPPAYAGHRCQYQNERVSLTMQFRTTEWSTVFILIIMLVDNYTFIHSFEQLEYLAMRDCRTKFNVNLLYASRAKPAHRTYYVRIDVYDKMQNKPVSSLSYPVQFLFLPVYRLSRQVDISRRDSSVKGKECPLKCVHGQCTRYDNRDDFLCRCSDGYSGELCSIRNECDCAPHSVCVGTVNNRSICACPFGRFGPRCYLKRAVCTPNPCSHNSQCVPTDVKISESGYYCVCRSGFTGSKCEQLESRVDFSFASALTIPQSMLIHFIDITPQKATDVYLVVDPVQTTIITKIRPDQTSAVAYHNGRFHLIFVQIDQSYYLALLQHNHTSTVNISTQVIPENRCLSTSQLLEAQIRNQSAWQRARYYHTVCQQRSALQCFHDDDRFMCLWDVERFANCFTFDFKRTHNCFGNNYCENDGQCYQNHNTCPTASSCFCNECYYGARCQFTSVGYGLSIDDILGYSIWPQIAFTHQPVIIHVSTAITLLMFVLSLINGLLSIITFRTKKSLAVGSGVYLLSTSVASCSTMLLFTLKFLLLIFSHISNDMNKTFLVLNCTIMNMFLKSCSAMVDWLYTCVAIERVWTIYKGTSFEKKRSVKLAKWITCAIGLFTVGSYVHDPIFRHLLEDAEEQRKWCIVRYSPLMKAFSSTINLIHFLVPLSINLLSVLAIIVLLARQKRKVGGKKDQRKHLWTQFKQHKHYLLSSIILIVVAIPRLVISFTTKCMTTGRHPWSYLTAYFLSFVSPLLIFVFFALPSKFYRQQLTEETLRLKRTIQRRMRSP